MKKRSPAAPSLAVLIRKILRETDAAANPYFTELRDGSFDKADFIETQVQFYFAVVFFCRPMSALAAKIPTPELRLEILRNVWEEHGEGNMGLAHGETFLEFLSRLGGLTPKSLAHRALWPEVRVFNTALAGACVLDEYLVGVAMMGIIERMFCEISGWIGRGVVARGWLKADRMIHYDLHETLDLRHSRDFFAVLKPAWDGGGANRSANRYSIEQGLRLGATLFDGLYAGLHRNRARRLLRDTKGPHSRAEGVT